MKGPGRPRTSYPRKWFNPTANASAKRQKWRPASAIISRQCQDRTWHFDDDQVA